MAKLYFRYGAMNSAKTLNLLAVHHNYRNQGKKSAIVKPHLDNRFGESKITSRAGLSVECDVSIKYVSDLLVLTETRKPLDCILADEAQFFSVEIIDALRMISIRHDIPVICYGLRTDFKTNLFPGSRRLMELADSIEEIKTTCLHCNKKAIFNMRTSGGKAVKEGNQIELGAEDKYESVCPRCYYDAINIA
jgi:thymidine kinase